MDLKNNILANYASQIYVSLLGIVVVPIYVKHMGIEAYGLVGFFAMLQAWFGLLDLGLTPTISRETSRFNGGASTPHSYRQLFRSLSMIFTAIAVVGGVALGLAAGVVSGEWLQLKEIGRAEVEFAIRVMAISIALRWVGGLYRGVIAGFERLVWVSGFNAGIGTLRFLGVLLAMHVYGSSTTVFFVYQALVAVLEFLLLRRMTYRLVPDKRKVGASLAWSLKPANNQLRFAMAVALTSSIWVVVTQMDKLILSGILPLADYGNFSLAVLLASGVMMLATPLTSAVTPHVAKLDAERNGEAIVAVYRRSTKLVSVLAGAAAMTLVFFPESVLHAWSGNAVQPAGLVGTIVLYVIGNTFLNFSSFAYCLQYAKGNMRYHVIGNVIMLVLLAPLIVLLAHRWGGIGAGFAWAGMNVVYLLVWVGYTHRKLAPGLHPKWLAFDILAIMLPTALAGLALRALDLHFSSRFGSLAFSACAGLLLLGVAGAARKMSYMLENMSGNGARASNEKVDSKNGSPYLL